MTTIPNLTGAQPSRIGIRGQEDLGGDLKAIMVLENGLNLDTGVAGQGSRLIGRQAYVGLAGSWGKLTVGRNYSMVFWSILEAPIMGPNAHGLGAFDSYLLNARADNSASYLGTFGAVTVGATYSRGRGTVNAGPSRAAAAA